ncbi:hypothetical protein KR032_009242, partial [Drosophila birchii]
KMSYLNQIRPVLFLFYTVETILNIILIHFYLGVLAFIQETTLMTTPFGIWYYLYLVCFYIFTVMTLFACVNVCTKNQPSIAEEVLRPLVAFIAYTMLTLLALYDAEIDFPLMFPKKSNDDPLQPEEPVQPYFKLLRAQAKASLVCSVVYLLHCIIALDVLLSNEDADSEHESLSDNSSEDLETVQGDYQPVRLYVVGTHTQRWLEKFQWFRDYVNEGVQDI